MLLALPDDREEIHHEPVGHAEVGAVAEEDLEVLVLASVQLLRPAEELPGDLPGGGLSRGAETRR